MLNQEGYAYFSFLSQVLKYFIRSVRPSNSVLLLGGSFFGILGKMFPIDSRNSCIFEAPVSFQIP